MPELIPTPAAPYDPRARALRDGGLATVALLAAVYLGSGGLRYLDDALLGYLGATVVATFGVVYRASAFWRRRPSAFYARALFGALRRPARLRTALAGAGRDLAAQRFIARRSRLRWLAHVLLSLGTLASFAITVPLVCGWMHFEAEGESAYRVALFGLPAGRFALDGAVGWLLFHALSLAGVAVALGAAYFLGARLRLRRVPGVTAGFHIAPLLLLLGVALTGLALPASRAVPGLFPLAAWAHELSVVLLLVALPFSKLGHLLIRPLQIGAQVVRAAGERRIACSGCGEPLAPAAQSAAVEALLAERGFHFDGYQRQCPACRRRQLATAQAQLLGAHFHPRLAGTRPAPPTRAEAA